MTQHNLRVCIMGTLLSIGVIEQDEFQRRVSHASGEKITVTFMISGRVKYHVGEVASFKEFKLLPQWLNYILGCFRNLSILVKQDIFVTNGPHIPSGVVWIFSKSLRKKSMLTIHGHFEQEWEKSDRPKINISVSKFISRYMLPSFDMIVVNDDQLKQELIDLGVESTRIFIRYVFADTEKFNRKNIDKQNVQDFQQKHKLPESYVLFVGKLTSWDGADDMMNVIKQVHKELPGEIFVFVGDGELRPQIEAFVKDNSLSNNVILTGYINKEMMPLVYYGAKMLILPNHPPQAGVGRISLEGLSMKIPVVAYDIGEFRKIVIDDQTGYLVPEGNTELLAAKVTNILKNSELQQKMGTNGRKLVKNKYDIDLYIKSWLASLYKLRQDKAPEKYD